MKKLSTYFFGGPALDYARKLRSALDEDPEYLKSHRDAVMHSVRESLRDRGITWDENVLKESAMTLVWEAVVRLRCVEKGRRERST